MNNATICRFCGRNSKLVESHIIPDFLFRDLKDKNGMIQHVTLNNGESRKVRKSDFVDNNLLCSDCDNRVFGGLEAVASNFLLKSVYPSLAKIDLKFGVTDIHREQFSGLKYQKLKLFILSVLWRAHHSQQPMFKNVNLGVHEAAIKQMLIAGDAGDDTKFEVAMINFIDVTGKPLPLIIEPETKGIGRFLMGGIAYLINLQENGFENFRDFTIKSNGQLTLTTLSGNQANILLKALGAPAEYVDNFTYRIYSLKGNIVNMAKNGHFDVLLNFRSCNGKLKGLCEEIRNTFGQVDFDTVVIGSAKLSKIAIKKVPLNFEYRENLFVVDAFVKLDDRNARPFDLNAFKNCLTAINDRFASSIVGIPKSWAGYAGWNFDHETVITAIDHTLNKCKVILVSKQE